jgi:hypothetical protein
MKNFLIFIFLVCSFSIFGQVTLPIDKITGKVIFTDVISLDSVSVENIYDRAKLFVVNNYNSAKTVSDLSDNNLHFLVIKAYTTTHFKSWGGVYEAGGFNYVLKIYCKDGRYKYEISDLIHTGMYDAQNSSSGGAIENEKPACGTMHISKGQWDYIKKDCVSNIEELIKVLKQSMLNKSEMEKKDW